MAAFMIFDSIYRASAKTEIFAEAIQKLWFSGSSHLFAFLIVLIINIPRRKRRGTVLNVSHCMFYKVVAVGFNTLCYDAKRRGIKPSARIRSL